MDGRVRYLVVPACYGNQEHDTAAVSPTLYFMGRHCLTSDNRWFLFHITRRQGITPGTTLIDMHETSKDLNKGHSHTLQCLMPR